MRYQQYLAFTALVSYMCRRGGRGGYGERRWDGGEARQSGARAGAEGGTEEGGAGAPRGQYQSQYRGGGYGYGGRGGGYGGRGRGGGRYGGAEAVTGAGTAAGGGAGAGGEERRTYRGKSGLVLAYGLSWRAMKILASVNADCSPHPYGSLTPTAVPCLSLTARPRLPAALQARVRL